MHCYMYGKKDIINKKRLIGINLFQYFVQDYGLFVMLHWPLEIKIDNKIEYNESIYTI